jgi:hypothetical protein
MTGTISESFRKYTNAIQGSTKSKNCRQQSLSAESTDVKVRNNMGINITRTVNCNYRAVGTLYTVETWFVTGI